MAHFKISLKGVPATIIFLAMAVLARAETDAELCQQLAGEKDLGGVWFNALDSSKAIGPCENAVAQNEQDTRSLTNLARALLKSGDYKAAQGMLASVAGPMRGRALNMQAYMLEQGLGNAVDEAAAFKTYHEAAEAGYHPAQNNIASKYLNGEGTVVDYAKALFWYRKSAGHGNAYAQNNLGHMYNAGLGVAPDGKAALRWFEAAAEQNFGGAHSNLAHYYHSGKFVEPIPDKALAHARLAVKLGNSNGLHNLGQFYLEGFAVEKNYGTAWNYFSQGAADSNSQSQFKLGWMLQNGWGRKIDLNGAAKWYEKAADQGLVFAQFNLAQLHDTGADAANDRTDRPRDVAIAEYYYRKAALQGDADAQDALAGLHKRFQQFALFRSDAIHWHMLAYSNHSNSDLHRALSENSDPELVANLRHALIKMGLQPRDTSLTALGASLNNWSATDGPLKLLNRLKNSP